MAQDGNDLWIGHLSGLIKMDMTTGAKTYYNKSNSPLPENYIKSIAVDHNGIKWIGTWGSGIVSFDGANWTVYDSSATHIPNPNYINSIAIDNNNNVLFSASAPGILKFDGTVFSSITNQNSGLPDDGVLTIYTEGNNIWANTVSGLAMFDGTGWNLVSQIFSLQIEKDDIGNIWLLKHNGLEKYDGVNFSLYDNTNTNIQNTQNIAMTIDSNNVIWTGCEPYNAILGGIQSFDGSNWTKYDTANSPISDIRISSILSDNTNNLWIGGFYGMIDKKIGTTWQSIDPSEAKLANNDIRQIAFDANGNPFIGTMESRLNIQKALVQYDGYIWTGIDNYNDQSWAFTTDKSGNLFIKNRLELKKFDGTNWSLIPNPPNMSAPVANLNLNEIVVDTNGGIWMDFLDYILPIWDSSAMQWVPVPHEGLAHFDGTNWTTYNNLNSQLPDASIRDIKIDRQNNVWILTDGLVKFDGTNWFHYTPTNSTLPSYSYNSIAIDSLNNVWLNDGHFGFVKFDGTNSTHFTHPALSFALEGYEIAVDLDGSIWGVYGPRAVHFDGTNWTTYDWLNAPFPGTYGLTSISIDKYGNKWIGTDNGILVYRQGGVITSTSGASEKESLVTIHPNPFHTSATIKINSPVKESEFTLYDIQGKIIRKEIITQQITTIKRNSLSDGIYFYKLSAKSGEISTGKIVIQ